MTKIMQVSDFEGNRAYAKTHADDDSVQGLTSFVNNLIKGASTSVDLTNYFTKEEIKQLLSDSIKESLKDYYTKEEVKEFMATGTDLSDYYTKEQIDSIIDKIPKTDLSNYYTKTDVDKLIKQISSVDFSLYSTTEEMKEAISSAISDYKPDMSNYYDKATIDSKFDNIKIPDMSNYLNKLDTIDAINSAITEKLESYYTKDQTDLAIKNVNTNSSKVFVVTDFLNSWKGKATFTKIDKLVVFQVLIHIGQKDTKPIFKIPDDCLPDLTAIKPDKGIIFIGNGYSSSSGVSQSVNFLIADGAFSLRASDFLDQTRSYNVYGSYYTL